MVTGLSIFLRWDLVSIMKSCCVTEPREVLTRFFFSHCDVFISCKQSFIIQNTSRKALQTQPNDVPRKTTVIRFRK